MDGVDLLMRAKSDSGGFTVEGTGSNGTSEPSFGNINTTLMKDGSCTYWKRVGIY
jgi:hypothetical protein